MHIEKIMSKPVITCEPGDSLSTAAQRMWDHDCGVLVVVDGGGRTVGVVTDRDICMAAYIQGLPLKAIAVSTAMATQVASCRPQDDIGAAEDLMRKRQIRRLVVVDAAERPVGLVSLNDIARNAVTHKKQGAERELALTLAAICEPRPVAKRPAAVQVA